ncbi:hypothetical protein I6F37_41125, partial [Bradyrhizobium sp. NBAIM08]
SPAVSARPAAAVWSPLEYGVHVRDVYRVFGDRLASMLAEEEPTFANWDQNRTKITKMDVPDFFDGGVFYGVGERYGNVYGKKFVTSCAEFTPQFQAMCGEGKDWQKNSDGFIVWIGSGNSIHDGVTKNLWQSVRPGCIVNG